MKKVYVSISGTSTVSGESDKTELVTEGEFKVLGDKYLLKYQEQLSDTGDGCTTIIKINDRTVVMSRSGSINTQMIFENGKKHIGHYETPIGSFTISVSTEELNVNMHDGGGNVEIRYILDINNQTQIENYLNLNIIG